MKRLLLVALFVTSLVSAKGTLTENPVKNVDEKQTGKLEMICCTRTGTATISDGQGNSTTVSRTVTGCSSNVQGGQEGMCAIVQSEANKKAIAALTQSIE